MDASTRRRALRAAAKLAVGVTFGACGGAEIAAVPPTDASREAKADDATVADLDAMPAPPVDLHPATYDAGWCALDRTDAGTLTPESARCCLALTTSVLPADAGWSSGSAFTQDPTLLSCCQALASNGTLVGWVYGPDHWPPNTCQACADAIHNASACTPWGPPMPPAMTGVA